MVKFQPLGALMKAFSSGKIHLPHKPLSETRWVGITLIHFDNRLVLICMDCSVPYLLASDISVQEFNSFIETKELSGYKFEYNNRCVYIVDMCSDEHEAVISELRYCFGAPFPSTHLRNCPVQILGQPRKGILPVYLILGLLISNISHHLSTVHMSPDRDGSRISPDLAILPHSAYVPPPPVPYPGPPPSSIRVICHIYFHNTDMVVIGTIGNTNMVDVGKPLCQNNL